MRSWRYGRYAVFVLAVFALIPSVYAEDVCQEIVGRFVSIEGKVDVQRDGAGGWRAAKLDLELCEGDTIRVDNRSRAAVQLINNAVLRVDQNSIISLLNLTDKGEEQSWLDLRKGAVQAFSRRPLRFKVDTPTLKALTDGTEFLVQAEEDRSLLMVLEGHVRVWNEKGSLTVAAGEAAAAEAGKAPELRTVLRPRDAVRWALYYVPVLYFRPDKFTPGADWQGKVRQSIDFYLQRDLQNAFESIADVPATIRDARFFAYRASLLLTVGRADEARADIGRALDLSPDDSHALALQAIIALVQNEKEKALTIARKAIEAAPDSATAFIALSYAQQARFDLEGARASLEKAVQLDPENALAWARLAEIHAAFGRLDQTLQAARKAIALQPDLARTQTVLGFAYLTQVKTRQARAAFEKAIGLDQADPLPRLGLGLAKIRQGDLHEGRREIEAAASLDPNNALIRSYLGKAYYEEKRVPLDKRQYAIAKELDPRDPTPWLYEAIAKQTTNRPVEALHDLQRSIELNDNRVVYRSRLLLDSDLATRSASIGRIYSDLGFQQLALREGWKSVNIDSSNFSAHRLLADTYAVLPRHEIARVSELLQSQLLQPLNMTPIQPRLAESNLFLIGSQGPGALSFNEFNPIFNRDGVTLQAHGLAGENSTYAGEGILSGIYKNASLSLGGFHFTTDGFRENAEQRDDIANAFVQLQLSYKTSIQAEYRYRNAEHGDVQQRFFQRDFFRGLRDERETNTIRLGGRHALTPDSILLGSFIHKDADVRVSNEDFPEQGNTIDFRIPENAFGFELQHLFRSRYFTLQTGAGHFGVDSEETRKVELPGPNPIETRSVTDRDLQHLNAYGYANVNLMKNVTATLGLSFDFVRGDEDVDQDQINPKFGITWTPLAGTTLRGALFRTLKRTLINDQTIEPTQVAGFNQLFDDPDLTETWRYGGAIDQKFTRNLFGGVEFSRRDMTVPFARLSDPTNPVSANADWNEYLGLGYLFWTPDPRLSLRADYRFERFDRDERFAAGVRKLDTHRVLVGMHFFDPSGVSASLTPTYWHQDGRFDGFFDPAAVRSGRADFWTVDAAVSYRLPRRYGFISVGATNLFDEKFRFFDIDVNNPTIQPVRTFFVRLTLALP
jgi:tetratricopeptide (TPR) repeat protein